MHREIIFRGKVADEPDEWVYGYLLPDNRIQQVEEHTESKNCGVGVFTVKPETVGQYTNITDKDEQMIFEGDIISDSDGTIYTVEFNKDRGGWFPFAQGDGCGCCEHEVVYDYSAEIIGNKYDSREN